MKNAIVTGSKNKNSITQNSNTGFPYRFVMLISDRII